MSNANEDCFLERNDELKGTWVFGDPDSGSDQGLLRLYFPVLPKRPVQFRAFCFAA
jgi:hypothetical protein